MDLTQILPDLYLGSHPRSANDIDTLSQHGITAVLNLQTEVIIVTWASTGQGSVPGTSPCTSKFGEYRSWISTMTICETSYPKVKQDDRMSVLRASAQNVDSAAADLRAGGLNAHGDTSTFIQLDFLYSGKHVPALLNDVLCPQTDGKP